MFVASIAMMTRPESLGRLFEGFVRSGSGLGIGPLAIFSRALYSGGTVWVWWQHVGSGQELVVECPQAAPERDQLQQHLDALLHQRNGKLPGWGQGWGRLG